MDLNLSEEITAAQTRARRDGNQDWQNVQAWQVEAKMGDEARAAWKATGLPPELLRLPVSKIREYAERRGIEL